MSDLPLSLAMCVYDRTQPLLDGRIKADGIDLTMPSPTIEECITGMLHHRRWDAAEMSFSAGLIALERGEPAFTLLPIFPSRYFRHSAIFVNAGAGIERPEDLRGKRVGVPVYARMAAAVWVRGMLEDDYGISPSDVTWVVPELLPVGSADNIPIQLPSDVKIEQVDTDPWIDQRLAEGEIDALVTARLPRPFLEGDPRVVRLFPDPKAVEADYFRRTGIFPPMHVIAVRRELYEAQSWIGPRLFDAFVRAKHMGLKDAHEIDVSRHSLAWWVACLEEERAVLGNDPWTYGVIPNRHTIETFAGYCHRQGLLARLPEIDEIFPANLLDTTG